MTDQTEREALSIHKDTGEWLSGGTIVGRQGAVIAASVLPGVTPEQVEAFYANVMEDDPTPRTVTTVEALRALPHGTHLRGALGQAYLVLAAGVFSAGREAACTDYALSLPATVLAPAIDPDDEALVEKVARAAFLADNRGRRTAAAEWDNLTMIPPVYEAYRTIARAALKAVTQ